MVGPNPFAISLIYLQNIAYPFSLNNSTRNTIATASGGQAAGSASNPNASQPQGHCCFVVQDTFNVNYWASMMDRFVIR